MFAKAKDIMVMRVGQEPILEQNMQLHFDHLCWFRQSESKGKGSNQISREIPNLWGHCTGQQVRNQTLNFMLKQMSSQYVFWVWVHQAFSNKIVFGRKEGFWENSDCPEICLVSCCLPNCQVAEESSCPLTRATGQFHYALWVTMPGLHDPPPRTSVMGSLDFEAWKSWKPLWEPGFLEFLFLPPCDGGLLGLLLAPGSF